MTLRGPYEFLFPDAFDCFFDGVYFDFIFFTIFPVVGVVFVQLNGIDVTRSSVHDAKS